MTQKTFQPPATQWHALHSTLDALTQDRRLNTACTALLCQWPTVQPGVSTAEVNVWINAILRGSEQLIECNECASAAVLFDLDAAQAEVVAARVAATLAHHGVVAKLSTAQRVKGESVQCWMGRLGAFTSWWPVRGTLTLRLLGIRLGCWAENLIQMNLKSKCRPLHRNRQ